MKRNLALVALLTPLLVACSYNGTSEKKDSTVSYISIDKKPAQTVPTSSGNVVHINATQFKELIFDYTVNKQWNYKGNRPCIVDFYADWCGPCKLLSPMIEKMAHKYIGKLDVFKVNIDENQDLAAVFGVNSIPSVLYCPMSSQPQMTTGLLSEKDLEKAINVILLK